MFFFSSTFPPQQAGDGERMIGRAWERESDAVRVLGEWESYKVRPEFMILRCDGSSFRGAGMKRREPGSHDSFISQCWRTPTHILTRTHSLSLPHKHTRTHSSPLLSFISSDPTSVSWLDWIYILLCFPIGGHVNAGRFMCLNLFSFRIINQNRLMYKYC